MGSNVLVYDLRGIRVAVVHGPFDITNATEIGSTLRRAARYRDEMIVSLRGCSHIDIDGIATLLLLHRRLGEHLILVCAPQRIFETTGLQRFVRIERSIESAVRRLTQAKAGQVSAF